MVEARAMIHKLLTVTAITLALSLVMGCAPITPTLAPTATPTPHHVYACGPSHNVCWASEGGHVPTEYNVGAEHNAELRGSYRILNSSWRQYTFDDGVAVDLYEDHWPRSKRGSPRTRTYTCGPEYNGRCLGQAYPDWVRSHIGGALYRRDGNWVEYSFIRDNTRVVIREWAP